MLKLLGDFIGELRAAGIPISMSEHVDSAKAMEVIDLSDRSLVKNALAATLVKDGDHMPVFTTAFEVFFSTRSWDSASELMDEVETGDAQRDGAAGASGPGQSRGEGGGAANSLSAQELAELLYRALRDGDREALRLAAGARSSGRGDLLPLSDAAKSRSRASRTTTHPRDARRRPARGTHRARRGPGAHRDAEGRDRARHP